ncbi:adenosylcobinamide-GDP ribazoletransferase [Varunaivibrio sulfuroxidans]|uniref:Adenosylcobinamide-GDP ribazoletransferase n=1 Tax=Varunaivibrio sulfuroxidans TaxID=1773489 RepID=A0A4R3JIM6_9PROT|nr:adenosylcobinamide-GDP ribazoletransferase [Varunaivibrio sulfuroxidans]TCS65136.1 cobalamin-5'-phosphate synthase [Varunaivibrio sulfuroxidans]WES29579.1 adenosylcobinamide-GDP ribazoletransferase [Varunaivibrio sulfuroxidans]
MASDQDRAASRQTPPGGATPADRSGRIVGGIRALAADFLFSLTFLTRLPIPLSPTARARPMAQAMRAFPLVGALIGLISGIVLYVAAQSHLHPLACTMLALATAALMTGALHEDGLADVADGFGGGRDMPSKLAIMRDSTIGAYGAIALILVISLKATALGGLPGPGLGLGALVGAHALARGILPVVMLFSRPARSDGLGAGAGDVRPAVAWTAAAVGGLFALLPFGPRLGLIMIFFTVIAVMAFVWIAHRQIGGYTGDVLGAAEQIGEVTALLAVGAFWTYT